VGRGLPARSGRLSSGPLGARRRLGCSMHRSDSIDEIPGLIQNIYGIVSRLEELFPGRRFTPDGHLVGTIGEVLAAHRYDLQLFVASAQGHDARSRDGKLVQVKATQGNAVALRSEPAHLIVLTILRDGSPEEVYNGPGSPAWMASGRMQKNGQRPVSLSTLRKLMASVAPDARLPSLVA